MATREAACHCGQLRLDVTGDPFSVSICNCLACQRRTGSAFGMQAGFKADQVQVVGRFNDYSRISDEADRKEHVFHFCPECGSQVFYTEPSEPELIVVSVGSFADPSFPPPTESGYDTRRHPWVGLPDSIQRGAYELWDPARPPLRGRQVCGGGRAGPRAPRKAPRPGVPLLQRGVLRKSRGQTAEALQHLRRSIEMWEGFRGMANGDTDFDPIRDEPAFGELVRRAAHQHRGRARTGAGPLALAGAAPGLGGERALGARGLLVRDRRRRTPAALRPAGPADRDRSARGRA